MDKEIIIKMKALSNKKKKVFYMKKTAEKRLTAIQKYLLDHGKATVKELSSILQVTPEMIRKDLSFLEEKRISVSDAWRCDAEKLEY